MEWISLKGLVGEEIEIIINPTHITHFEIYAPLSDKEPRVAIYLDNGKSVIIKGEPYVSYILWKLTTPKWKKFIYKFYHFYLEKLKEVKNICLCILKKSKIKKKM